MKIIKRNGSEAAFDITKIIVAVSKANKELDERQRLTNEQIRTIAANVEGACVSMGRAASVEEIQDLVEKQIMGQGAFDVAKEYICYRYTRSLARRANTTDNQILSLIECNNEEVKQENANKNPTVNSVQRDYMAGEVSKDITRRILLPREIVEAHEQGIIHFHDMDYFAQHAQLRPRKPRRHITKRTVITNALLKSRTASPPLATSPRKSSRRLLVTSTAVRASASHTSRRSCRSPARKSAVRSKSRSASLAAFPDEAQITKMVERRL